MADVLQQLSARLQVLEYEERDLRELLGVAARIAEGAEFFAALAVQERREAGLTWAEVAEAASLSVGAARARWSGDEGKLSRWVMQQDVPETAGKAADAEPGRPRAAQRLAAALTSLHRRSGRQVNVVAEGLGVSSSYVSRIMNGDRLPGWDVITGLVLQLNGNPKDFRLLWEHARGITGRQSNPLLVAVDQLGAALRGLHLAAGEPDFDTIQEATDDLVEADVIARTLHEKQVPDWEKVTAIVRALNGDPSQIKPLWEAVEYRHLRAASGRRGKSCPPDTEVRSGRRRGRTTDKGSET
ncbi:helix-turn-helix domain-containing protein [Streptomyces sp. MS19]|uniref:helix-turn-helix domain-containing protein n=1 Tax=Streptomyces sp. MS19 TaxID=3385972 RepID=UPI0039A175F4